MGLITDIKNSFTAADGIPIKLVKNREVLNSILDTGKIPPIHVQFIPTNKCNLSCSFCSCSALERTVEMSFDDASRIIDLLYVLGTKSVTITGGGDPLTYSRFQQLSSLFHDAGIKIGLVTNGFLLERFSYECLDWCRISNSDERNLNQAYFNILEQTVESNPEVDWAFSHVVSASPNVSEIKRIIEFAHLYNFTHVRLVADLLDYNRVDLPKLKRKLLADNMSLDKVIFQSRNTPKRGGNCYICYLKPMIGADCKVYACCLEENEPILVKRDKEQMYIPMKEVKVSDYAVEYGEIINVFHRDGEEGLEIILEDNRTIYVSNDHLMLVFNKSNRVWDVRQASTLQCGELVPVKYKYLSKDVAQYHEEKETVSYETAEFLGYYAVYGLSSSGYTQIRIPGNLELYQKRFETVCDRLDYAYSVEQRREGIEYTVQTQNGFVEKGRIPSCILNGTERIQWGFLRGYFGGNGYRMETQTDDRLLANDFVYLFTLMGVPFILKNEEDSYHIKVKGVYDLLRVSISDFIQRKERYIKDISLGVMYVPIKEIRKRYLKSLVDIQVAGLNMFISSFGIVTHNCGVQYALKEPSRSLPQELCLGDAFELDRIIHGSNKPFDGSICHRCYYTNYNTVLEALLTETEHMDFI